MSIKRSLEKETNIEESYRKLNMEKVLQSSDWRYQTIRKTLQQYSPAKTIIDGTQPTPGQTFVSIVLYEDFRASYSHQGWCEASWMTGSIIPCYGDLSVHHVEYVLHEGQIEQRRYNYTYTRRGAWWIGLLPFVWVNLFTNSHEDALASTVHEFLIQAKKEGLLLNEAQN